MKGVVFSFKNSNSIKRRFRGIRISDLRVVIKRYGIRLIFVGLILIGMILGAIYAKNADSEMISSLDFLFTTNLDARLSQGFFGTFCACLASDFLFLFSIYLFGFAPWGIPFMLLAVLFKGFGIGITAGYLFITNSLSGVGFYLLILLPGTFLFCIALILFSNSAFLFSKRVFAFTLSKAVPALPIRNFAAQFTSKFLSALILTFCSALLDTALWTLFAGAFNF